MTRAKLPPKRPLVHHQLGIGGHSVHLSIGLRGDGAPGEVFLDVHKEGAPLRALLTSLARVTSLALQRGATVAEVANSLRGEDGGPAGDVEGHDAVTAATSIPDLVAQVLAADFGGA